MIGLLLRLYPAAWRGRYGDEFAAMLEERPLGPFDVADVLLAAIDAHLNLRGRWAEAGHRRGFSMTLRIGGAAAALGGATWAAALVWGAIDASDESEIPALGLIAASVLLLIGLVGLSAFQARIHPRLVWAAFAIPAVGNVVSIVGLVGIGIVGDRPFLWADSPWAVWMVGLGAIVIGSLLFALATARTAALSRPAGLVLAVGSAAMVFAMLVSLLGLVVVDGVLLLLPPVVLFAGGWIWLGVDAIRRDRPALSTVG